MLFISTPSFAIYQVWTCTTGEIIINGVVVGSTEYCYYEYFNDDDPWGQFPLGPQEWGGGGGTGETQEEAKENYCERIDQLKGLISALPITGTASTVLTIGEAVASGALSVMANGYEDIRKFNLTLEHWPYYGHQNAVIDWFSVQIDWSLYDDNWTGGTPTTANGGSQQIMANYMHSLGLGTKGGITVPEEMLPEDPDPSTDC